MNTPIQGSAADIIKLAMLRIQEVIEKEMPDCRMLLQVHDELILMSLRLCWSPWPAKSIK